MTARRAKRVARVDGSGERRGSPALQGTKGRGHALELPGELTLSKRTTGVIAWVESKPGAIGTLFFANRGSLPIAAIYKVMGKMFAIVAVRGGENVILKCDPELVPALKDQYTGVGHRSHLDRRFWISVSLDADVPVGQIKRLISQSYELVCANLTRKQQAELAQSARASDVNQ